MDADDLEPRKAKPQAVNLETMSIEALEDYIRDLEAEIGRARETIAVKRQARSAAASVFRS